MKTKTCNQCGQTKAVDHFTRLKVSADGFGPTCRACQQTKARQWRTQLGLEHFTPESTTGQGDTG